MGALLSRMFRGADKPTELADRAISLDGHVKDRLNLSQGPIALLGQLLWAALCMVGTVVLGRLASLTVWRAPLGPFGWFLLGLAGMVLLSAAGLAAATMAARARTAWRVSKASASAPTATLETGRRNATALVDAAMNGSRNEIVERLDKLERGHVGIVDEFAEVGARLTKLDERVGTDRIGVLVQHLIDTALNERQWRRLQEHKAAVAAVITNLQEGVPNCGAAEESGLLEWLRDDLKAVAMKLASECGGADPTTRFRDLEHEINQEIKREGKGDYVKNLLMLGRECDVLSLFIEEREEILKAVKSRLDEATPKLRAS